MQSCYPAGSGKQDILSFSSNGCVSFLIDEKYCEQRTDLQWQSAFANETTFLDCIRRRLESQHNGERSARVSNNQSQPDQLATSGMIIENPITMNSGKSRSLPELRQFVAFYLKQIQYCS